MSKNRGTRGPTKNLPSYRKHKASGQGVVTLDGVDFYLGAHGTKASKEEYDRIVGEWQANGRRLPADRLPGGPGDLTVNELCLAFWKHVEGYYVKQGEASTEQREIRYAIRPLRKLYGSTLAREFSPRALKAIRAEMVRVGWCRSRINKQIRRVKMVFKWGTEEELIPPGVFHGLQAVCGLRRGRSDARETEPIRSVPQANIDAVLPFLSDEVAAMVRLQCLTGARPGEVTIMRACDIDMSGDLWLYTPSRHKTEHHGRSRVIGIGPRGQKILKPFLTTNTQQYLFSPAAAEAKRRAERHAKRKTPLNCGNRPGSNRKRRPRKQPKERYSVDSYNRAIAYACAKTWPVPDEIKGDEAASKQWRRDHSWSSGRLRHTAATVLRKRFGLELTRAILGHASAVTSETYAELDTEAAKRVMAEVG